MGIFFSSTPYLGNPNSAKHTCSVLNFQNSTDNFDWDDSNLQSHAINRSVIHCSYLPTLLHIPYFFSFSPFSSFSSFSSFSFLLFFFFSPRTPLVFYSHAMQLISDSLRFPVFPPLLLLRLCMCIQPPFSRIKKLTGENIKHRKSYLLWKSGVGKSENYSVLSSFRIFFNPASVIFFFPNDSRIFFYCIIGKTPG